MNLELPSHTDVLCVSYHLWLASMLTWVCVGSQHIAVDTVLQKFDPGWSWRFRWGWKESFWSVCHYYRWLQYMKQQLLLLLFKGIKCGKVLRNVFSVYLRKILLESCEQMVSNNTASEDYGEMWKIQILYSLEFTGHSVSTWAQYTITPISETSHPQ